MSADASGVRVFVVSENDRRLRPFQAGTLKTLCEMLIAVALMGVAFLVLGLFQLGFHESDVGLGGAPLRFTFLGIGVTFLLVGIIGAWWRVLGESTREIDEVQVSTAGLDVRTHSGEIWSFQ